MCLKKKKHPAKFYFATFITRLYRAIKEWNELPPSMYYNEQHFSCINSFLLDAYQLYAVFPI